MVFLSVSEKPNKFWIDSKYFLEITYSSTLKSFVVFLPRKKGIQGCSFSENYAQVQQSSAFNDQSISEEQIIDDIFSPCPLTNKVS